MRQSTSTMYADQYTNYGMNFGSDKVSDSIVDIRLGKCAALAVALSTALTSLHHEQNDFRLRHNLGDLYEGCVILQCGMLYTGWCKKRPELCVI